MSIETLVSSEFNLQSRIECVEFLESLRAGLLQEVSNINHIIEWMMIEEREWEKVRLEKLEFVKVRLIGV